MIRLMERKDCLEVSMIHKESLEGDFLPILGLGVLNSIYQGLLKDKGSFGYVAEENGEVIGFITGSETTKILFKKIIKQEFFSLSYHTLLALIKNPFLIKNLTQTLKYNEKSKEDTNAELISIAIKKEHRGNNFGKKLTEALIADFKKRNIKKIKVTVNKSNNGANKFYQKIGFKSSGNFHIYSKEMNLYTLEI